MKTLQINFRCFGPFEQTAIDLSGASGLCVVFGTNEAGKSSALRGLQALLFGFPGQSDDNFRFAYNQFRIRAVLENSSGYKLECIRRKGLKDTLRKGCDKEVISDRDFADQFLPHLDEARFEQLFGLNATQLVEGGNDMLKNEGEFRDALFAAGAGMKGLRILSQRLQERQNELYLAGGRNQLISVSLRKHRELNEKINSFILKPEDYAHAKELADQARIKVDQLTQERVGARLRLALLRRYQSALPTIDLLALARCRLAAVADAPILSADFDARLESVRESLASAKVEVASLESERQKLEKDLEEVKPPAAILREEGEINELNKQIGADVKLRSEEVKATTFSIDDRGKARDIYRELTGSTDWEKMDILKPRLDECDRVNELANARSAVFEDEERQQETVADSKGEIK